MKKRILIALIAAGMLTGCSSQTGSQTVADPVTSAAPSTAEAPDNDTTSTGSSEEPSVTTPSAGTSTAGPTETTTPTESAAPDSPAETTTPAYTTGTSAAATSGASTTKPATKPDPKDETRPAATTAYTGRDIGGTGRTSDDIAFDDAECAEDVVGLDGIMSTGSAGAISDYGYIDPIDPIDPIEPVEPVPGWEIQPEAGLLTGGEWNDNDNWDFWKSLFEREPEQQGGQYDDYYYYNDDWNSFRNYWNTHNDLRVKVTLTDNNGAPVSGAKISTDKPGYAAVTNNRGEAFLFYSERELVNGPTEFTVTAGDTTQRFSGIISGDTELSFTLDSAMKPAAKSLDLMIMCDTTGSMGDELEYLKKELEDVVTRVRNDNGNIPVRISVNFYRDEGDEYVVREFPFTDELSLAVGAIAEQYSDGGGDTPEAVHTALDSAVNSHDWDEDSVKVMFLVLDAPPHEDAQIVSQVLSLTEKAAGMGIRIVPVAASGVDKSCEFLLRNLAFMTGGTYTFLTDDSGIGFSHTQPTIGSYTVEKLNDMMVRICNEYLD